MKAQYDIIDNKRIKHIKTFIVDMKHRSSHIHSAFEFCLILHGKLHMKANKNSYIVSKDDILLFNPGVAHEFDVTDGEVKILSVQVSKRFCSDYFSQIEHITFENILISDVISDNKKKLIKYCLIKLCYLYYIGDFANEFICMTLINTIFITLLKSLEYTVMTDSEKESTYFKSSRIIRIIDYIENNYSNKLLLSNIALREGISMSYLSHLFKDTLNITFRDYLNSIRFDKAKLLAINTNMNGLEICIECGFSDVKYLQKMFISNYQCKLKDFRAKYQLLSHSKNKRKLPIQDLQYLLSENEIINYLSEENCIADKVFEKYTLITLL